MPKVRRYKYKRGFYIKTRYDGCFVTYQTTRAGDAYLEENGFGDESSISPGHLYDLKCQGLVTTGGSGTAPDSVLADPLRREWVRVDRAFNRGGKGVPPNVVVDNTAKADPPTSEPPEVIFEEVNLDAKEVKPPQWEELDPGSGVQPIPADPLPLWEADGVGPDRSSPSRLWICDEEGIISLAVEQDVQSAEGEHWAGEPDDEAVPQAAGLPKEAAPMGGIAGFWQDFRPVVLLTAPLAIAAVSFVLTHLNTEDYSTSCVVAVVVWGAFMASLSIPMTFVAKQWWKISLGFMLLAAVLAAGWVVWTVTPPIVEGMVVLVDGVLGFLNYVLWLAFLAILARAVVFVYEEMR